MGQVHDAGRGEAAAGQAAPPFRAAVITLSDKGSRGEREDLSGPLVSRRLRGQGFEIVEELLLPDDEGLLRDALLRLCDEARADLIVTTGGTGFSPRDRTPEATLAVADRAAPGVAEAIRAHSMSITPRGMLSRGASVIRGGTLIVNLPGSPKAAGEGMDCLLAAVGHGLEMLRGGAADCARP